MYPLDIQEIAEQVLDAWGQLLAMMLFEAIQATDPEQVSQWGE